jgi:hypothetical protein
MKRETIFRKTMTWSGKLVRLGTYFLFVALILTVVAARIAYAHAKRMALDTGNELVRLTGNANLSGVYRLRINGEEVRITSAVSSGEPKEIADRFQKSCEEHADGLATEFATLRESLATPPRTEGGPGAGLLREDAEGSSVVVCFATGGETSGAKMYARVADFAKSGDLSKIGHVRYVLAKKAHGGGAHVVALWTEGTLDVKKMFPESGDSPGSDVPNVMRPPNARRVLTAYAEGTPYAVRTYESAVKGEAILKQYDDVMPKTGWMTYPDAVAAVPYARTYSKDGLDVTVTVQDDGERTLVSLVDMGH